MRIVVVFLFLLAFTTSPANAVLVAIEGTSLDSPPEIALPSNGLAITLELANPESLDAILGFAQISLDVIPLGDASGGLSLSAAEATAPFFSGSFGSPLPNPNRALSIALGEPPTNHSGAVLSAGSRAPFFELIVEQQALAKGRFEVVFSEYLPAAPLSSSHWAGPGLLGSRQAFQNSVASSDGQKLLATFVFNVPEPNAISFLLALCLVGMPLRGKIIGGVLDCRRRFDRRVGGG